MAAIFLDLDGYISATAVGLGGDNSDCSWFRYEVYTGGDNRKCIRFIGGDNRRCIRFIDRNNGN